MAILTVNKTYADGQVLGEQNLDNAFDSIEDFVNSGSISAENIQDNSITAAELQTATITNDKIAANAVTTPKIQDGSVTLSKLATDVMNAIVPTGMITAWAGDVAPTGWLICDGTAVSRTTYSTLYALVGNRFGQGNNTTTFNVPDLRGRFLRGADGGSARDPEAASRTAMNTGGATGSNVGSVQNDDFAWTELRFRYGTDPSGGGLIPFGGNISTGTVTPTVPGKTGQETRPKNAYTNFIIKV